jgi:hypothetical protein
MAKGKENKHINLLLHLLRSRPTQYTQNKI